jgi:hypothetical protein
MDANQPKTRRLTRAGGSPAQSSKRLTRSQTARKASSSGTRQAATKPHVNRAGSASSVGTGAKRITRGASSTYGARVAVMETAPSILLPDSSAGYAPATPGRRQRQWRALTPFDLNRDGWIGEFKVKGINRSRYRVVRRTPVRPINGNRVSCYGENHE